MRTCNQTWLTPVPALNQLQGHKHRQDGTGNVLLFHKHLDEWQLVNAGPMLASTTGLTSTRMQAIDCFGWVYYPTENIIGYTPKV